MIMKTSHFTNIGSLAELKRAYRRLALQYHPDRGGDITIMQQINLEFGKLYAVWKDRRDVSEKLTGYENDYSDASAREYTEFVYNEYRWRGRNYKGQRVPEIADLIRTWLRETYPRYRFSVTRDGYGSIRIFLMSADFEPFAKDSGIIYHDVNQYHIDSVLTDRAREVMSNIRDFAMSYNYDNSDVMTDYFDTNFYLSLGIGKYNKPYKVVLPRLDCKGKKAEVFRHPEGKAHKAVRQALGKARFGFLDSHKFHGELILGEDTYSRTGERFFWPKTYSSAKTAQKRIDKLEQAGIRCELTGCGEGVIRFIGYTPVTEHQLETERQEYAEAYKAWQEKHQLQTV
uniref:J domain-containing protein n=1 Tax=Prevotella sp. GTC17253 TaxID=3236793 RepID=A0AB33IU96_9BACT